MQTRLERQARNEALVRMVNERIEALDRDHGWPSSENEFEFHCECGRDGGCPEKISLTLVEYEEVREQDDRFALHPGHETPELERVVKQTERYVIVDKVPDAEPFVADDPRGAQSR